MQKFSMEAAQAYIIIDFLSFSLSLSHFLSLAVCV